MGTKVRNFALCKKGLRVENLVNRDKEISFQYNKCFKLYITSSYLLYLIL